MKPFNLQEALEGKPVVTRDGKPVKRLVYFPEANEYPVVAYSGDKEIDTYTAKGEYISGGSGRSKDLFMDVPTKTGWVNIYRENLEYSGRLALKLTPGGNVIHPSKTVANEKQETTKDRIAVIELTWEE